MTKKYLFTYGTLKRGYGNNRLLSSSKFIGEAVVSGYKLYNSGFPVATKNEGSSVLGEIWEVDTETTWSRLDSLEGYPYMYGRDTVSVLPVEQELGDNYTCEMYVGNSKNWRDFKDLKECPKIKENLYEWSRL